MSKKSGLIFVTYQKEGGFTLQTDLFPTNPAIEKAKRRYRYATHGRRREMWLDLRKTVKLELEKELKKCRKKKR